MIEKKQGAALLGQLVALQHSHRMMQKMQNNTECHVYLWVKGIRVTEKVELQYHSFKIDTETWKKHFEIYPLWNLFLQVIVSGLPKRRTCVDIQVAQHKTSPDLSKILSVWMEP